MKPMLLSSRRPLTPFSGTVEAVDGSEIENEERDERMPANQTNEDRKTQPTRGGEVMAVKNRLLTLSCKKRPKWLKVDEGLKIFELSDSVAGRRRFTERLEVRARKEKSKECGLPTEDICKGGQSTLRRGWFWGAQAFEEWLRGKVRADGSKPQGRALRMSAESKACHDEQEAEQVVVDGMKSLHLKEAELKTTVGSDPRKVAIAHAVHQKTAVARQWTAARLEMKSAMNVCQQIKRLKIGKLNLPEETKRWLSRIAP